jgi:hypothetical protein
LLEIAALLHDIGKIGVPDAILLKAGPLTPQEQELMRTHQRHGLELVRVSFKLPELCAILGNRITPVRELTGSGNVAASDSVPLGAKLLAIADSYDSMITQQVYRAARSPEEAFTELRRCAGTQFDPELVERFIAAVRSQSVAPLAPGGVSKEAALAIGQHLDQLVSALDRSDLTSLQDIAKHMNLVATKQGVLSIAQQASELESTINSEESDLLAVLREADELLQLCRQTQRTFFEGLQPTAAPARLAAR